MCLCSLQQTNEQCVEAGTAGGDSSTLRFWTFVCQSLNTEQRRCGWLHWNVFCFFCGEWTDGEKVILMLLNRSDSMSVCSRSSQTDPRRRCFFKFIQVEISASRCSIRAVELRSPKFVCGHKSTFQKVQFLFRFFELWQICTRISSFLVLFSWPAIWRCCCLLSLLSS